MEFLSHFLAIVGILALVVSYIFKRNRTESHKKKSMEAPQASGAWPFIGHLHLLGGKKIVARTLAEMADKHGPILSLRLASKPALVVSSWELMKDCFTTHDRIFATRPSIRVGKYFYDYALFALSPYGPYWRDVRKMVTLELLTAHRLDKLKHLRGSEMNCFLKDLHALCVDNGGLPTKVSINHWFEHLTFNISTRTLVGKRYSVNSIGKNDTEEWRFKEAIKRSLYLTGVFTVSDVIPSLEWMDIGGYVKSMKQTAREVDTVLGKWLEEHIQKRKERDHTDEETDFMDVMLSSLTQDAMVSGYTRDTVIKATTMILIMTGSESTAETLTWCLSLLLNNRRMLKKAQDELDTVVGRDRWVEESDVKNLTYIEAILKETLRLYPAAPLAGPRESMEDCEIGGYHVPKGTRLIINLWKLHRDPRVWSDPTEFQPERFLNEHAELNFKGQNFEYVPFGSGRRMCPGLSFGALVVQMTLARLLQAFDVSTPMNAPVDLSEGLGIALPKATPLDVTLTPRLSLELYHNL